MIIQGIKCLEQFLEQNNMTNTLKILRAELLSKVPNKPSKQFLSLLNNQKQDRILLEEPNQHRLKHQNPQKNQTKAFIKKKQKKQLPVQGLLGKIAYSQKLVNNSNQTLLEQKIHKLMDNKIFQNCLTKIFPENNKLIMNKQQKIMKKNIKHERQYIHDQLDMIDGTLKNQQDQSFYSVSNKNQQDSLNSSQQNQHQISSIIANDYQNDLQNSNMNYNLNNQQQISILSQNNEILQEFNHLDFQEEYQDDRDFGYHEEIFDDSTLMEGCQQLSRKYGFPDCAILKAENDKKAKYKQSPNDTFLRFKSSIQQVQRKKFSKGMIFPCQQDQFYPLQYNGVSYDMMKIRVIYDRQKIGYQKEKDLNFRKGDIIAGRYQIQKILGSGVFAKVIKAKDLYSENQELTCFKMIQNDKDFIDQALDQLKLLRYIKANCDPNQHYLLNFKQVFYHRQHLFIETDLLKDNLLTAFQMNPSFFSIGVIRKISIQILQALATLHSLNIIHADLKPQNIMIKSYNPIQIRVIDLGNGTFTHDSNLSNYVQSRSYRAPQVVLGCGFNQKIDIWSLGCIIAQLWTKNVLFYNYHIQGMLSRIQGIVGPWPQWMLINGNNVPNLFSNQNFIYSHQTQKQLYHIYIPKKTTLKNRIRSDDQLFIDFIRTLIEIDPLKRVSAEQALLNSFLKY